LNRYPRLKQAFNQLSEEGYNNFEIQWIGGMAPTLLILDENGNTLHEEVVSDMDTAALTELIKKNGVVLAVTIPAMPSLTQDPTSHTTIGGIRYELFVDQVTFGQAEEYANSRTYQGQKGRLPTISCPQLQEELKTWIEGNSLESEFSKSGIWLGATDEGHEGKWIWKSNDVVFFDLGPVDGVYNNWSEGEPNNANSNEHCASWVLSRGWNDVKCLGKEPQMILVEYGPNESLLCSVVPPASPQPRGEDRQDL